ncbi:uncharacterized protein LOC121385038 [Gigantopelta aegis]|uniref:uncharacterized protein LOC121385038 n=1 Tax=Gigantopelta aegis TaxID=1735272 RepID=UPI001B88B3D8|nr:uncharacterized protein LOC121385038 [Gigantopelta aegis]
MTSCYGFPMRFEPHAASNSGREFVVVFLEHVIRRSNLDFYITTGLATNVSVEISAPGLPSKQAPIRLTLTHGITSHAAVNTNLALKGVWGQDLGTQKAKKGIFISSDGDISVQCYTTSTHSAYPNSVGGYLALPTDALGKEYMITTYCEANSCAFAVVGTEDDTQVQLVLKLPPSKRVRYSGTNYYSGDTISETIDRFEAIELMSSGSFSGTVVTSSRNVAVFIGTDFSSVGEGSSMDAMTEQLAPLDTWGMDYFLVPFPGRSTFDLLTVTAQFNNTLVELNGTRHTIMEEGTSINLKLPSDAPAYLWSNKRVLVLQLSTSHGSDTDFTDPSMLAVPPIKQWSSGYTFASSSTTSNAEDVALALIANTSCVSEVSLSHGLQLVHLNWTVVAGVGYSISYTTLQDGFYEVRTLAPGTCPSFGGYLYGPGYNFAWSMPIGQSFKILPDIYP